MFFERADKLLVLFYELATMIEVLCNWRCRVNNSSRIQVKLNQNPPQTSDKQAHQSGLDFNWRFPSDIQYAQLDDAEPIVTTYEKITPFAKPSLSARRLFARLAVPVVIALLIGCFLGYISLNLIKNQLSPENQNPSATFATESSGTFAFFEKNINISFIQSGVFSTKESANETAKSLPKGTPQVVLNQGGKYYLFTGIASSLEQAKALAQGIKTSGGTAYWKAVDIEGKSSERFSASELEQLKMLQSNIQVMIAAVAAERMNSPLQEWHTDEVLGSQKGQLGQLIKLNNDSISKFRSYTKSKTPEKLAETEQKILDFLKIYQTL